jgi:hypothetical protein
MEAYLVSGVGVLSFTSGAWGVLSPTTLRELIRNLVILRPRRLQLFATFLIFYGTLMAGVALPPESKTQIAAAILGILLTTKGTVAFLMAYMEGLRSALPKSSWDLRRQAPTMANSLHGCAIAGNRLDGLGNCRNSVMVKTDVSEACRLIHSPINLPSGVMMKSSHWNLCWIAE